MNETTKILYGIAGIGNGHTNRQIPVIDHYAQSSRIMIFAYGESLATLKQRYTGNNNVAIEEVAVPYYVGSPYGLDFSATLHHPANVENFFRKNMEAFVATEKFLGRPDIAITDYEPTTAQFAYAKNIPLVTFDQQSKYLCGEFPDALANTSYKDEVERLMMFFPAATKRIASSFFKVPESLNPNAPVEVIAPIIKDSIVSLVRRKEINSRSLLVYLSSQKETLQSIPEFLNIFQNFPDIHFHMFIKGGLENAKVKNVTGYKHGDRVFAEILSSCDGIISTAGHSLLSEAMFLQIPVFAMPLPVYEQQMNAHVIHKNSFGVSSERINNANLKEFIDNLEHFEENIRNDKNVLLRSSSIEHIVQIIESARKK